MLNSSDRKNKVNEIDTNLLALVQGDIRSSTVVNGDSTDDGEVLMEQVIQV